MTKKYKFISLALLLIITITFIVVILFRDIVKINSWDEESLEVTEENGETITWEFHVEELTDEEYEQYMLLKEEGVSFIERLEIVKPDKYQELIDNPDLLELLLLDTENQDK